MPGTFIITGANGNLGTAVVKKFLDEGYKVIAVDSSASHLSFASSNPAFSLHSVDLTNEKATVEFVNNFTGNQKIDGALLLAGGFAMGGLEDTDSAALQKMYALNFETAYHISRTLFPHLLENGYGRIILVGARPALDHQPAKQMIAYALSKSLVFKYAELLNQAGKGKNVTATVVVPSTIDTQVNRQSMPDANFNDWVKAEEIAAIMELICSGKGNPLRETVLKIYNNS